MKFGYLGPNGTYSSIAVSEYCEEKKCVPKKIGFKSLYALFQGLHHNQCDQILAPIENSTQGSVQNVMDLLMDLKEVSIVDEWIMTIENALMMKPDSDPEKIKALISHPQPLGQCQALINQYYPDADLIQVESTALAAQIVAEDQVIKNALGKTPEGPKAVIGNQSLAQSWGLKIIKENMNDIAQNQTRFVVISKEKTSPSQKDKTSLIFSTKKDQPGSLATQLKRFSDQKINLTKIESRPSKTQLGEYLFYIDIEGHIQDALVAETIDQVEKSSTYFKWLGSYPMKEV